MHVGSDALPGLSNDFTTNYCMKMYIQQLCDRDQPELCSDHDGGKTMESYRNESNAPQQLDVLIIIPEHEDSSRKSKETKETAEVELDSCQSGTGIRACIDEGKQAR